jgi:tetratricopeptide (TPR) repeat protein
VDTQTRHALKQDKFAYAAATSANWISGHKSGVVRWVIIGAAALAVIIAALVFWSIRSSAADTALGAAMDTYTATLSAPGATPTSGEYATSADRSKAANQQFLAVASKYSLLPQAAKAHYFAGITYEDMGQNGPAETELKTAAGAWDRNLANLAKVALAELYQSTSRNDQAIAEYNELIAKPSTTVSAAVAQLDLADLYAATGKKDQAKALWAKVHDADKDGAAGAAAEQKLTAK